MQAGVRKSSRRGDSIFEGPMISRRDHPLESGAFQLKERRQKLGHTTFNLCLSCVLVLLVGCSAKRPVQQAESSAPSPTIESESSAQDHLAGGGTTETVDKWSDAIKT